MSSRPCAVAGCPHLRPCPKHPGRPRNAKWSRDRTSTEQARFRKAVLDRDGWRCTRCGATTNLVAHHVRPGTDPANGKTLCETCHNAIDSNARARTQ